MSTVVPPLIGITTSEVRRRSDVHPLREGDPPQAELALGMLYMRAVERAGGIPVVLSPLSESSAIEALLDRLSGICLSGGPDLDPTTYGAEPHPELGPVEPELDDFELQTARRADARGLPILGICRGAQAINVARGGTLLQHLPDRTDGTIAHRQAITGRETTHSVSVEPGSRLATILGRTTVDVNSFHHQAVEQLGRGLRTVAWASDGVIEGLEADGPELLVGVQWHAETLIDKPDHLALFEALVAAAAAGSTTREQVAAA